MRVEEGRAGWGKCWAAGEVELFKENLGKWWTRHLFGRAGGGWRGVARCSATEGPASEQQGRMELQ